MTKFAFILALLFSSFSFAHQDAADQNCRVVLREAHMAGCLRGSCNLFVVIDIKSSLNSPAPGLFYKAQNSNDIRLASRLNEVPGPQGYRRFVSDGFTPIQADSTTTELIPFVVENDITYFDHNVTQNIYENYVIAPGITTYQAASSLCN